MVLQMKKIGDTMENEKSTTATEAEEARTLDDEKLEKVSGGNFGPVCPICGSSNITYLGANNEMCAWTANG